MMTLIKEIGIESAMIILIASLIQSVSGFGFGLFTVPMLLFVLQAGEAIAVGMLLCTFSFFLNTINTYEKAHWGAIKKLLLISIPGLVIGVMFSNSLSPVIIKGLVGIVLIVYVSWQWHQLKYSSSAPNDSLSKTMQVHPLPFYSAGFFSGLLNGLAAIPGPPIVALLVKHLDKDEFYATIASLFTLQYLISLSIRLVLQNELFSPPLVALMTFLMLPLLLGYFIGEPIRRRIQENQFKSLVYVLLLITGIISAWEPFCFLVTK